MNIAEKLAADKKARDAELAEKQEKYNSNWLTLRKLHERLTKHGKTLDEMMDIPLSVIIHGHNSTTNNFEIITFLDNDYPRVSMPESHFEGHNYPGEIRLSVFLKSHRMTKMKKDQ